MGVADDLKDFDGNCRLFPLPHVVHFPHAVLPLHIFEPRYRQMTEDALAGDKLITIVQLRDPRAAAAPGRPAVEAVGCLGKIVEHRRLADGRFTFLLLGLSRVRLIRELASPRLYRRAQGEILEDRGDDRPDDPRRPALVALFRRLAEGEPALPEFDALLETRMPLGVLTDLVAHALGVPAAIKQQLLAEPRVDRRADALVALLRETPPEEPAAAHDPRGFPPPFSLN